MEHSFLKQAANFLRNKKIHKRYIAVLLCLALVVSLGTVMALKLSGQAQNHTEKVLDCAYKAHEHTADCYDGAGTLICGRADYVVHIHNEDCYDASGVLVCQLPVVEPHTHSESCYTEERVLVCGREESAGHVHTGECYARERGGLTCGQEESAGHAHTGECYTRERGGLICTLSEHTHDETCLDGNGGVICGLEEHVHSDECYSWAEALTCGQEESAGHTHTDSCYDWIETLVCQIPEGEGAHAHTDECYAAGEKILSCGRLELHTHTDACYERDDGGMALVCGLPELVEHVHGEECFRTVELTGDEVGGFDSDGSAQPDDSTPCYDAEGNLICGLPEHTHVGSCIDERGEFGCGFVAHTHIPYTPPETEEKVMTWEDGQVVITASYTDEAGIPDGAELRAYPVTAETAPERYDQRLEEALDAVNAAPGPAETIGLEGESVPEEETPPPVLIYNIGFYVDGEEIEPAAPVTITIQFLDAQGFAVGSPITVVHFSDEGSQTITGTEVDENGSTSFVADGFSDYAIIGVNYALNTFYISTADDWYTHKDGVDATPHKMHTGKYILQNSITVYRFQVLEDRECVIDLNGYTLTLEEGSWVEVRGKLTIMDSSPQQNGTLQTYRNNERLLLVYDNGTFNLENGYIKNLAYGGAVYLNANATLNMKGGHIIENNAGFGAGVYAEGNAKINIYSGEISNNNATRGGGIYAIDNVAVTMNGGEISHNTAYNDAEWYSSGGGIYMNGGNTKLTINDGTISYNECNDSGGGIRVSYGKLYIYGGRITENTTQTREGGGIAVMESASMVIEAKNGKKVYITNNHSYTTKDWGGGGIFIMGYKTDGDHAAEATAVIVNARIEDNTANGFGGGLGACSTGSVFLGNGEEGSALAAIFGNTANGQRRNGESEKNNDHEAYDNSVFMSSGYQDVYSALNGSISADMLGGGNEAWVGSTSGVRVRVNSPGFVSADRMLGLTSTATQADRKKARKEADVIITGNTSTTHGGGIMCNGRLAIGWKTVLEDTPSLVIKGKKQLTLNNTTSGARTIADEIPAFTFILSESEPAWVNGRWQAKAGTGVLRSTNDQQGSFEFDVPFGGGSPSLKQEVSGDSGTYIKTFYFWEAADNLQGMEYDPTLYMVTVPISWETDTSQSFEVAGQEVDLKTIKYTISTGSITVEKKSDGAGVFSDMSNSVTKWEDETHQQGGMNMKIRRTFVQINDTSFSNTWSYRDNTSIKIVKESDSGQPVVGAQFELYKWDNQIFNERNWQSGGHWNKIDNISSASGGVIYADDGSSSPLEAGTYRIVETSAPVGYIGLGTETYVEFEVVVTTTGNVVMRTIRCVYDGFGFTGARVDSDGSTMVLHIPNEAVTGTLKMVKYGKEQVGGSEKPLKGASFSLYADEDQTSKLWTAVSGADGALKWTKADDSGETRDDLTLEYGTYYLFEESAPAGYSLIDPYVVVNVTADGKVVCELNHEPLGLDGEMFKLIDESEPFSLPETGGSGGMTYTLGGAALILTACTLLYRTKVSGRRKRGE